MSTWDFRDPWDCCAHGARLHDLQRALADNMPGYSRRFAGRMETGKDTVGDQAKIA